MRFESTLSAESVLVDLPLDVRQGRQNVFERPWLGQVHIAHRLIVTAKRRRAFRRRYELKRGRDGEVVTRPSATKEAALPLNDALPQLRLRDGIGSIGVQGESRGISVVASESIRSDLFCRPMMFSMQNCCLLPERSVQIERDDVAPPVGEHVR